jgi:hypothetical protein
VLPLFAFFAPLRILRLKILRKDKSQSTQSAQRKPKKREVNIFATFASADVQFSGKLL